MTADVRAAGDAALLIDTGPMNAAGLAAVIDAQRLPGVLDVVPGARTVLVVTEPGTWDLTDLARRIAALPVTAGAAASAAAGSVVEIEVVYDGPDLDEVAELAGLTAGEVVARHQAGEYRVGWLGFAPGFGYLTGLDDALAGVPRRATPRVSVPAGSVAIAGGLAAVYPTAAPGGWRILGRTDARLWDAEHDPPALLRPGSRVRFRAVPASETGGASSAGSADAALAGTADSAGLLTGPVEVIRPGPLATVQDLGRTGYAHLGVPRGGAADLDSFRLANELAGNPETAAALELTLGRAEFRFAAATGVAVTGAPVPITVIPADAGPAPAEDEPRVGRAFAVPAGARLKLGAPSSGLRTYLAVRGGFEVPAVLGSRSAELLSGLGPRPLRVGDRLPIGEAPPTRTTEDAATAGDRQPELRDVVLRIVAGPRDDWFTAAALVLLTGEAYQVTPASNRTGLRLAGPALSRGRPGELPSEGLVAGAIQVPPDGQPILLLADHPATGGYPVIAVVSCADVGRAAQLRPGQQVRFALVTSGGRG